MPISYASIPPTWRLPLYYVETDPSKAGFPTTRLPALLVGQMFATAAAAVNVPIPISQESEAIVQFGQGSQLHRMVKAFLANNLAHELWCLPVAEPSGGVKASGTVTVASAPTDSGTLYLYIAGQRLSIGIDADDLDTDVAAKIVSAVTAAADLPVDASQGVDPSDNVVTLTSKWKGLTGNDIDVRVNYGGSLAGETVPAGLSIAISGSGKLASGTAAPDFTTAISNLGDENFEYVAMPFTDSTSLNAWEAEYGFGDGGRWGFIRQLYGHLVSAKRDTYANLLTFGASRNSGLTVIVGVEVNSPTPVWEWAAAFDAKAARALVIDPARPLQTLHLDGILPAPKHQRFLITELNNLAGAGIATQAVGPDGIPQITRETTTYQKNLYGVGDDAYTDMTTLATLAKLFRNQKQAITSKFPRHKIADDGTRFGAGQAIVTPKSIKAELVAQYRADEFNGLVENGDAFKANLIVERDANNPVRVNMLYPPDLINGLRIFAVLAQFRLQYNRGFDTEVAA